MDNIDKAGGSARGFLPSIFDVATAGILGLPFISNQFLQGSFFVFYSLFIFCLTLSMTPRRSYKSWPLAFLVVWSLGMVFLHNKINVVPNSIINSYFNVSIAFEGFIYILCGVLLFNSIVIYSKNPKWILCLMPIALIPLIRYGVYAGSLSAIGALIVSAIIYFALKKKYQIAAAVIVVSIFLAIVGRSWIQMKFACRPYIWIELSKQIIEHPFIGAGFNHTLLPDNMVWIRKIGPVVYGWIWAHNDYLNLARSLGAVTLVFISCFLFDCVKRIGRSIWLIPFLIIAITSFFQITMFQANKAVIGIVLIAVCLVETYKGDVA